MTELGLPGSVPVTSHFKYKVEPIGAKKRDTSSILCRDCSGYGLTGYGDYKSVTGYKILTGYETG